MFTSFISQIVVLGGEAEPLRNMLIAVVFAGLAFAGGMFLNSPKGNQARLFITALIHDLRTKKTQTVDDSTTEDPADSADPNSMNRVKDIPTAKIDDDESSTVLSNDSARKTVDSKHADSLISTDSNTGVLTVDNQSTPRPIDPSVLENPPPVRPLKPDKTESNVVKTALSDESWPETAKQTPQMIESSSDNSQSSAESRIKLQKPSRSQDPTNVPRAVTREDMMNPADLSENRTKLNESEDATSSESSSQKGSASVDARSSTDSAARESFADDWKAIESQMNRLGITRYTIEGNAKGRVIVHCEIAEPGHSDVSRRFESEGADMIQAARAVMKRVSLWKLTEDSFNP